MKKRKDVYKGVDILVQVKQPGTGFYQSYILTEDGFNHEIEKNPETLVEIIKDLISRIPEPSSGGRRGCACHSNLDGYTTAAVSGAVAGAIAGVVTGG